MTIRSLYKHLKVIKGKVAQIADEASHAPHETGEASEVSSTSHSSQDDAEDHSDPLIPKILSSTSSAGEDLTNVEKVDDLNAPSSNAAEEATEFGVTATEESKKDEQSTTDAEKHGQRVGSEENGALDADDNDATKRVESAEGELKPDNNKTMTAQEARVKRMRERFLNMKNLIDGEDNGLLWTAEEESVPPVEGNT